MLIAGDGAMQQTAAELGTLLGQGLAPVIIVLSNDGYTAERAIHHPEARVPRDPGVGLDRAARRRGPGHVPRGAARRHLPRAGLGSHRGQMTTQPPAARS